MDYRAHQLAQESATSARASLWLELIQLYNGLRKGKDYDSSLDIGNGRMHAFTNRCPQRYVLAANLHYF